MAITAEARSELITLVVAMFNAAPGANNLSELTTAYEAGFSMTDIANSLAATDQFKTIYPNFMTNEEFATKLVDNMVGSLVSADQKSWAVDELTASLNAGSSRVEVVLSAVAALSAVADDEENWGNAKVAFENKVEVATYHSVEKQLSADALADLQQVVANVDNTDASVTAAKGAADGDTNQGGSFSLTVGIDDLNGGTGNDTFNAVITGTSAVIGALDSVDGGAGTDTLNIQDTSIAAAADFNLSAFAGFSISDVEVMNVTTNGALGTLGTTDFDISTISGLTSFTGAAAGAGTAAGSQIKAANSTDVNLTVSGANGATVSGGKAVTANLATGTANVSGTGLTSVTVNKGTGATISSDSSSTAGAGTSLKEVSLVGVNGNSSIAGRGLESVTVSGTTTASRTITVTNSSAADHSLTVKAQGTGYTAAGGAAATIVAQNTAKSLTLDLTGAVNIVGLNSTSATALTVTGAGNVSLAPAGMTVLKSIDGSSATGNLTLGSATLGALATTVTSVKTGSGNDSFAITTTQKATAETGAGNDTVTLNSALAAGSSVNLGAGNDKLLAGTGSVATSTTTDVTVIDAGDGVDSLSASLINAANAAQFKNFEALDLSAAVANLDVDLMTGSTIEKLTLSGRSANALASTSNVASGVGLEVAGNNQAYTAGANLTTIGVKGAAAATDNAFTVTFAGAAASSAPAAASVIAGGVKLQEIETINIDSAGGANTWNSITLVDTNKLKTVTITGARNLDLNFDSTGASPNVVGTNTAAGGAVTLIDGSAATGKLSINTTDVTVNSASAGLTINGGSNDDTITLVGNKATVVGGAGKDTIKTDTAGGTLTGGAGDDTFDVALTAAGGTTVAAATIATITDFSAGDTIKLAAAGTFTTAKVALDATVQNLDDALTLALTGAANTVKWFQYGTDTYLVQNVDATAGLQATDLVVKLTGAVDLTNATMTGTDLAL